MKNLLKNPLLVIMFLCLHLHVKAQEAGRQVSCLDSTLKKEADSLKENLYKQGFVVVKEATMTMQSEYEMPVIVPLTQGSWYQFIFIGDLTSKLYELRMYDYNERQVVFKKQFGDAGSNIISYSFIPQFTEYHMIKPLQVNSIKKKNICGYIIMMKKVK